MTALRTDYFVDVLEDCYNAVRLLKVPPQDEALIVAALIQSDSVNGLRKVLLSMTSALSDRRPQQP